MGADLYRQNESGNVERERRLAEYRELDHRRDAAYAAQDTELLNRLNDQLYGGWYREDGSKIAPGGVRRDGQLGDHYREGLYSRIKMHPDYYFRDSYNDSSLLWAFGMSWYGGDESCDPATVTGHMGPNGDGRMTTTEEDGETYFEYSLYPDGCRRLIETLRRREGRFEAFLDRLKPITYRDWKSGEVKTQDVEDQRGYYMDKYRRLVRFLNDTANAGDTVHCSI